MNYYISERVTVAYLLSYFDHVWTYYENMTANLPFKNTNQTRPYSHFISWLISDQVISLDTLISYITIPICRKVCIGLLLIFVPTLSLIYTLR